MRLWHNINKAMDNSVDDDYTDDDKKWLSRNIALVIMFFKEADKWRAQGKKISQRKIGHDLRWCTDAHDDSEHRKILNAGITLLAHVYNDCLNDKYFKVYPRKPFNPVEVVS